MHIRPHFASILGIATLSLTLLTGCQPEPPAETTNDQKSTSDSDVSSSPEAEESPASPPAENSTGAIQTLKAVPVDTTCEKIFPLSKLYDLDPNLALVRGQQSISSPPVLNQRKLEGLSCDLVHLSTGQTIQFGVVKLTPESAKAQQQSISGLSSDGRYQVSSSVLGHFASPTGQFTDRQYWVTVSSAAFSAPADAGSWSTLAYQGLPR